jgi:hypothetical protein
MQFMLLVYNDPALVAALPEGQYDAMMKDCIAHADHLREEGRLLESRMLGSPAAAKSVRIRQGKVSALDGPFAEAKEVLGGFNLIEAESMEEAVEIASHFPWAGTGCIEVRPVNSLDAVRDKLCAGIPLEAERAAATIGVA